MIAITPEARAEFLRILQAERRYWESHDTDDPTRSAIVIGATGALCNVIASVAGFDVPWHQPEETVNDAARLGQARSVSARTGPAGRGREWSGSVWRGEAGLGVPR
jgi:hypothetical protein